MGKVTTMARGGLVLLVLALTLAVTGCFEKKAPVVSKAVITGVALSPSGASLGGASVTAFDWADGKVVGTTATADSGGRFSIPELPIGRTFAFVAATGKGRGALIRSVAGSADDIVISPSSTLAAEYYAKGKYAAGQVFSQAEYRDCVAKAAELLGVRPDLNLLPGAGVLPTTFGSGVTDADVAKFMGGDPGISALYQGKAMVGQLIQAGTTIKGTIVDQFSKQVVYLGVETGSYTYELADAISSAASTVGRVTSMPPSATGTGTPVSPNYTWDLAGLQGIGSVDRGTLKLWGSVSDPTSIDFVGTSTADSRLRYTMKGVWDINGATGTDSTGQFTASYANVRLERAGGAASFTGDMTGHLGAALVSTFGTLNGVLTSAPISLDGHLSIDGPHGVVGLSGLITTPTMAVSGEMKLSTADLASIGSASPILPDDLTLEVSGTYSNRLESLAKVAIDGKAKVEVQGLWGWDPNQPYSASNWVGATATFDGSITPPSYKTCRSKVVAKLSAWNRLDCDVQYSYGDIGTAGYMGLSGTVGLVVNPSAETVGATMHLTSDTGMATDVTASLSDTGLSVSGTMTKGGIQVGTIERNVERWLLIRFSDGVIVTVV